MLQRRCLHFAHSGIPVGAQRYPERPSQDGSFLHLLQITRQGTGSRSHASARMESPAVS